MFRANNAGALYRDIIYTRFITNVNIASNLALDIQQTVNSSSNLQQIELLKFALRRATSTSKENKIRYIGREIARVEPELFYY